jgi:hypothetical protein
LEDQKDKSQKNNKNNEVQLKEFDNNFGSSYIILFGTLALSSNALASACVSFGPCGCPCTT